MGYWEETLSASMIRWIALLPFVAAVTHGLLIGLLRIKIAERAIWSISLFAMVTSFALGLVSLFDFMTAGGVAPLLDTMGPWIGGGVGSRSFSSELTFQFDPLSAVFSLVITGIAIIVYLYTIGLIQNGLINREEGHRTFAMLDLLVGSTLVLVLADNLLLFFLGWAGVGIASQLFSAFDFEDRVASRAGATTFVIGRIGDLGLLGSMLLLFDGLSRAGAPALSFRGIEAAFRLLEGQGMLWFSWSLVEAPLLLEIVGIGLVLAALTKCAQLPLHFWLPGATTSPVSATALMQSTTTVVAGIYVLLRFSFLLESTPTAMKMLIGAGAATLLLSSLAAANQWVLSKVVAYTTSGLLGLVIIGVGVGAYSAAAFLLLTHAFVKTLLILAMGLVVSTQGGETDLRRMGGLAYRMRWTQAIFGLGCLALVGMPPLANFFPIEELLAFLSISSRPVAGLLIAITFASIALLSFAMGRCFFLIFWGNVRPGGLVERELQDPRGLMQHSLTALAVATAFVGLLSPSQFWAAPFGVRTSQADSIGHFLSAVLPGEPDPALVGGDRWMLVGGVLVCVLVGMIAASIRFARRGYRGEAKHPALRGAMNAVREMLFVEQGLGLLLVRPLRWLSQVALVGGIENRLIDRAVVSGGPGLVRRFVWSGLRRLQNGLLQTYALLALMAVLVVVSWMVVV